MTEPTPKLPTVLSDLIALAISDARKLDREVYVPDFTEWHSPITDPEEEGECAICLAGAVIAGTLGLPPTAPHYFGSCEYPDANAIRALEFVRCGGWEAACDALGVSLTDRQRKSFNVLGETQFRFFDDWDEFDAHLASLEGILPRLRAIGL